MQNNPDKSFTDAAEPFRSALRLHCYRMLGSSHDSDDLVQETMMRAWRSRDTLKDPRMLRPWLYRIATNACIDEIERRPKRVLASDAYPPAENPRAPFPPRVDEPVWLEPMPDSWLLSGRDANEHGDPSARVELRESVALAFVAALQILTAVQRASLLLRDVVGLSAEETAQALDISVSAANSALFRARTMVEEKLGGGDPSSFVPSVSEVDERVLTAYMRAFEGANMDALVALLHADVQTTMPPIPTWIAGLAANDAFYKHMFATLSPGWIRTLRTRANGGPAFGFYRPTSPGEPHTLHAIQLVAVRDERILRIDHFMTPAVFPLFGLPRVLA
jgi:RNA polymerase sigma-70 factor (ECF subfamily)